MSSELRIGSIAWHDLTVTNADAVRSFYQQVVGWDSQGQDMGGYDDHNMLLPGTTECVAGICHARGINADIPPQWLIYIVVKDVDGSAARCRELGGTVLVEPRLMGGGRVCVIRDPSGAVCALYQGGS